MVLPRRRMIEDTIVCAAVRHKVTGLVFSLPQPNRHHHILHAMKSLGLDTTHTMNEQGFLTNDGWFVGREQARDIAADAGQLLPDARICNQLFSEDLW